MTSLRRARHPVPPGGRLTWAVLLLTAGGCTPGATSLPPRELPAPPSPDAAEAGIPEGRGTLRQDDITLSLRVDGVQIRVTPLEASITRLTAPDTWERLSGLDRMYRTPLATRAGSPVTLFLVSFFSEQPGESFRPRDLSLVESGVARRAAAIQPITPGWDRERLEQRVAQTAIYAFPVELDFDQPFRVEYGMGTEAGWESILPVVQRERSRIRSRGG